MTTFGGPLLLALASPYVAAAFGLAGSLIGGAIAGTVSLRVARQARDAAESSWMRDTRREIYGRFLTTAQQLLIACEARRIAERVEATKHAGEAKAAVERAHLDFFEVYGVVQTIAQRPVVDAARVYGYRLLELEEGLDARGLLGPGHADRVAQLVRLARHDTIDAMRTELGLAGSARAPDGFDPFQGTDLEGRYSVRTPR